MWPPCLAIPHVSTPFCSPLDPQHMCAGCPGIAFPGLTSNPASAVSLLQPICGRAAALFLTKPDTPCTLNSVFSRFRRCRRTGCPATGLTWAAAWATSTPPTWRCWATRPPWPSTRRQGRPCSGACGRTGAHAPTWGCPRASAPASAGRAGGRGWGLLAACAPAFRP